MGCGVSTMDAEDRPQRCHSNILRRPKTVRPVAENNMASEKLTDNGNGSREESEDLKPLGGPEAKTRQAGFKGEKTKENWLDRVESERGVRKGGKEAVRVKVTTENEENEAETYDREYAFTGPGSPSFREYCIDNDSGNPSFGEYCTLNEGDDDPAKRRNQPKKERISISNKEPDQKKERKGRRFRSVTNKRKSSGKRNIFSRYTSSHASLSENITPKKVVRKAA